MTYTYGTLIGQEYHPALSAFLYIKERDKVILTWTIKRNNSCNGIGIYRSNDFEDYILIGRIEGICGSADNETNFTFVDSSPDIQGINYYKLSIGLEGETNPPLKVEYIKYPPNGILIIPNPSSQSYPIEIYWSNIDRNLCTIKIYTLDGVMRECYQTTEDRMILFDSNFDENPYLTSPLIIEITNTVTLEKYTGKMLRIP